MRLIASFNGFTAKRHMAQYEFVIATKAIDCVNVYGLFILEMMRRDSQFYLNVQFFNVAYDISIWKQPRT